MNHSILRAVLAAALALGATTARAAEDDLATAIFAGGCFWCMEPPYDEMDGVKSTISGYIGGHVADPSYQQVTGGDTGHAEAVKIVYDPEVVDYGQLLHVFWRNVDPLTANRQFCDQGSQYRSAIFYVDERQKTLAEQSLAEVAARFDDPVVTEINSAGTFYPAEDYHQNYYEKNPLRYKFYRYGCGRDARLEELWGKEAGG
ncbi:MAG: peptide-methionine (S)-S-oxide reductase MsrA [Gammaproteobacteria bacterium]|jgi:peptide-methionine (S)-S-oxide reductase|nr:peptide-methionine (S)-S-oxide reductase MsrA [Gammaproteobacteria bacterium]